MELVVAAMAVETPEQLRRVLDARAQSGAESPFVIAAIRLLILTGARLGEVLSLRWEYVDLDRAVLNLPDSKTGPKTVYLSDPARAGLDGVPRTADWVQP